MKFEDMGNYIFHFIKYIKNVINIANSLLKSNNILLIYY